jgi:hypothetical protein
MDAAGCAVGDCSCSCRGIASRDDHHGCTWLDHDHGCTCHDDDHGRTWLDDDHGCTWHDRCLVIPADRSKIGKTTITAELRRVRTQYAAAIQNGAYRSA